MNLAKIILTVNCHDLQKQLNGSLATMAWHILTLWMERTATRYGGGCKCTDSQQMVILLIVDWVVG